VDGFAEIGESWAPVMTAGWSVLRCSMAWSGTGPWCRASVRRCQS